MGNGHLGLFLGQSANEGKPSVYQTIKEEIAHHIEKNNRYTRKQRPGPLSPTSGVDQGTSFEPALLNKQYFTPKHEAIITTERFIGSGVFQRILGNDFTFNHPEK